MFTIFGVLFGLGCTFAGYFLHGGSIMVFVVAWTEYIVILGAGVGMFLGSNGMAVTKQTFAAMMHLLKPANFGKKEYEDLLVMMYKMFSLARTDGLLAIESHIEDPEKSPILSANPSFIHNHHAVTFFCDTMKILVTGGVQPHDLSDMMEQDLDIMHAEETQIPDALQTLADGMPAIGIVACVLGVIITMGKIGGEAAEIGAAIGNALVGTFLGVLVAYVVMSPVVKALQQRIRLEGQYLTCIRHAIARGARGDPPSASLEFARRNIDPSVRPSFSEMDKAIKERGKNK
jgi:chemotaxis protein MotA